MRCLLLLTPVALAAQSIDFAQWNKPVEPVRIAGNIHYVGTAGISSFLITTPDGHILLDSGTEETVGRIHASVEKLGFRFSDVKILLSSHAHIDHVGGHALVKELTGARIMAMAGDAEVIEGGGKGDFRWEGEFSWKPVKVDRVLNDGDTVTLGAVSLKAHLTPGHTRGCTTWTMRTTEDGRTLDVVFVGGVSINPGVRVAGMPKFPDIAEAYRRTFRVLKELACDVYLAQHPFQFGFEEKAKRAREGARPNPFIDPNGYSAAVAAAERLFEQTLARERTAK
jgi:metallo-beta-lactamase class B